MHIPVLIEPEYVRSTWSQTVLNAIRAEGIKLKYKVTLLNSENYTTLDWDAVFDHGERMVLVLAPSMSWAPKILPFFEKLDISVILVVFNPSETTSVRGIVRMDYVHAMNQLLQYLEGCGRRRVALYGVNPAYFVDNMKSSFFRAWKPGNDAHIYPAYSSLAECYASFLPHARTYDAVICSNCMVGISLLQHLKRNGICVPEDLYLTVFDSGKLTDKVTPSLTGVTLDYEEVGRQAVRLFSWLYRQKPCTNVSVRVRSRLVIRQSTAMQQPSAVEPSHLFIPDSEPDGIYLYCDQEARTIQSIVDLLNLSDETDERLIQGLLENQTNAQLEESLFLSSYALRYRLKRMMALAHCERKQDLIEFLKVYDKLLGKTE